MLAEVRRNHRERRPVFRSPVDADWKTQRNGCRPRVTRDDFYARSRCQLRIFKAPPVGRTLGKFRKIGLYFVGKVFRITTGQTYRQTRSFVVIAIKAPYVVERQLFKTADLPRVVVAVWMAGVNDVVQLFFTKLFIVTLTQRDFQEVDRIVA